MIEKEKISALQLALMMYSTIFATAILIVPAITGKYAERDMWLSPIWGSVNGFFTAFIIFQLHKLYPKETIIQYSVRIIGKIPGKILGLLYMFFLLHESGVIVREYADFIKSTFLEKTPLLVVLGSMVLICAYAVRCGVEVIGRVALLFTPMFILGILILSILLLKDLELNNIFPIMENGVTQSLKGATVLQAWFGEIFLISMIFPYVKDVEKGIKWSIVSVLSIMISMVVVNMLTVFLLGAKVTSTDLLFPVFDVVRYISIANFFEHLETIIIAVWVAVMFIKISVFYFTLVLSTAQWLNLSDYRPVVLPLGFLLLLMGVWAYQSMQEFSQYADKILPFYSPVLSTVIPTLLLLIASIQNKKRKKGKHSPMKE